MLIAQQAVREKVKGTSPTHVLNERRFPTVGLGRASCLSPIASSKKKRR